MFPVMDYPCQQVFQSFRRVVFAETGENKKEAHTGGLDSRGGEEISGVAACFENSQSARMKKRTGDLYLMGCNMRKHTGTVEGEAESWGFTVY